MAIPYSYDILQAVIEATPDAIFVKDLDGRYVLVNEAAARFIGKSPADIIGKHDLELYDEETARQFIEADRHVLATGQPQAFEGVATGEAGTQAYLVTKGVYRDKTGQILGLFGISHDITDLQRAHEALAHTREALFRSQKMQAVGQLTGGIAHDFNNILGAIIGNLDLLRLRLPDDSHATELLDVVVRAALHGKDLIGQLLAFSGRRQLNPRPVDVNALVAEIVRLLARTIGSTIRVTTFPIGGGAGGPVYPPAPPTGGLDVALDARGAVAGGGALTLCTSIGHATQPPARRDAI